MPRPGHVLEQDVAAAEHAGEDQLERIPLADHRLLDRVEHSSAAGVGLARVHAGSSGSGTRTGSRSLQLGEPPIQVRRRRCHRRSLGQCSPQVLSEQGSGSHGFLSSDRRHDGDGSGLGPVRPALVGRRTRSAAVRRPRTTAGRRDGTTGRTCARASAAAGRTTAHRRDAGCADAISAAVTPPLRASPRCAWAGRRPVSAPTPASRSGAKRIARIADRGHRPGPDQVGCRAEADQHELQDQRQHGRLEEDEREFLRQPRQHSSVADWRGSAVEGAVRSIGSATARPVGPASAATGSPSRSPRTADNARTAAARSRSSSVVREKRARR